MDRSRFDAMLPEQLIGNAKILLIGCGGIGSPTAICLARMGAKHFTLVDPDIVEETNVCTQAFDRADVGRPKVNALAQQLTYTTDGLDHGEAVAKRHRRFEPTDVTNADVVIMAVDNMEARRQIFAACRELAEPGTLIIDARTGAETLDLYVFRTGSSWEDWYAEVVAETNDYAEDPCGARAIAYGGLFAAAAICAALRQALLDSGYCLWAGGDLSAHGMKVYRRAEAARS